MSGPPELQRLVRQWIDKGEDDFRAAEKLCVDGPPGIACFLAQQCVEKCVKAILTLHGIDFPKIHDISKLVARLPEPGSMDITIVEQERLTDYATVARYTGDYEPITLEEARAAVEIARQGRADLRRLIPEEILTK